MGHAHRVRRHGSRAVSTSACAMPCASHARTRRSCATREQHAHSTEQSGPTTLANMATPWDARGPHARGTRRQARQPRPRPARQSWPEGSALWDETRAARCHMPGQARPGHGFPTTVRRRHHRRRPGLTRTATIAMRGRAPVGYASRVVWWRAASHLASAVDGFAGQLIFRRGCKSRCGAPILVIVADAC